MTTTCTYHCSPCGRHFHSLEAFDAHHRRDENGWPQCFSPLDLADLAGKERLEIVTEHGECRVYSEVQRDVTIWTMAGNRERAQARFGRTGPESPAQAA